VLFRRFAEAAHPARDRFPDDTGYEAFINHFHVDAENPLKAVTVGYRVVHAVARTLQLNIDRPCRVILAIDEQSASVRFHVRRVAEDWLSTDLEGYSEPVLVVDYPAYVPYSESDYPGPTRTRIEAEWRGIINGTTSREVVHQWAESLMLGDDTLDPMVATALQYLHGFALVTGSGGRLRHGGPGKYLRSIDEVADELDRWLTNCREYDTHPRRYMKRKSEQARQAAQDERGS